MNKWIAGVLGRIFGRKKAPPPLPPETTIANLYAPKRDRAEEKTDRKARRAVQLAFSRGPSRPKAPKAPARKRANKAEKNLRPTVAIGVACPTCSAVPGERCKGNRIHKMRRQKC